MLKHDAAVTNGCTEDLQVKESLLSQQCTGEQAVPHLMSRQNAGPFFCSSPHTPLELLHCRALH